MIDIRKRIKGLLDEYSHNIVYIQRDERFHCECYIERSGEPMANCPKCFGTGFVVVVKRIRTRRQIATIPESLVGTNSLHEPGSLAPKAYVYYFEHMISPKVDDLILEVIWDINGVPRHVKDKYVISAVDSQLGYKGRIEFHQVYCRFDQKGDHDDKALTEH